MVTWKGEPDLSLLYLKAQVYPAEYVLFHIYISLMKAILFDFHWDLQALCQQWVSISYYGVSELPFILLAKLQG